MDDDIVMLTADELEFGYQVSDVLKPFFLFVTGEEAAQTREFNWQDFQPDFAEGHGFAFPFLHSDRPDWPETKLWLVLFAVAESN